ncbi:hypothetical protein BV898_08663 [Hypsibius exemplaris]|uniref:Uncharacterized protein n=1 Tax=Hypsibius exemplaris TaxID=2072580 RepID=A0A1W0WPY4_HYPEX|nr:hypothetical protein BV898_08663 [Hypsibius exemplaris]
MSTERTGDADPVYVLLERSEKCRIFSHRTIQCPKQMARRLGVSEATIRRLADGRLEKKKLKKARVHYLTAAGILQRSLRALPFYDLIKDS